MNSPGLPTPPQPANSPWTPQQWQAIASTDGSLLVSAAAGSGKTSVLAERCVYLVCDAQPRCNVSQLLVVTFTEAAAAEMKSRIEKALRERLETSGNDAHLRRQFALIEHAQISTLHSFCQRLMRQHFHRLGLDPSFRVLDGDQATLLRLEVARQLFLERYDAPDNEDFTTLVDTIGQGSDQRLIEKVVGTYEMLRSLVDPRLWLAQAQRRLEEATNQPLDQSAMGRQYLQLVGNFLDGLVRDACDSAVALKPLEGFKGYVAYAENLATLAAKWHDLLDTRGYDTVASEVGNAKLPRLPSIPNTVPDKALASGRITATQKRFKEDPFIQALRFTSSQLQQGLTSSLPQARAFLDLIKAFGQRYGQHKHSAQSVDFSDLEHYALRLLRREAPDGPPIPLPVAQLLHQQFKHVLVDEYQDINQVQDAILTYASRECLGADGRGNLFCVGDVKQSIYGFRLAEPTRFLERQDQFRNGKRAGRVIDLQANFRSRKPLLDALNAIFQRLMTAAVDIEYDQSQHLHAMATFPDGPPGRCFTGAPIQLYCLPATVNAKIGQTGDEQPGDADGSAEPSETDELERSEREAVVIAQRIHELVSGDARRPPMMVLERAKDGSAGYRPVQFRDIVVLLRATRHHAGHYADILTGHGIPVHNDAGGGFFDAMEVCDMMSLLRLLDNQEQDIPLAAILRSPLSGMPRSEDALARIRLAYPDVKSVPFAQAVRRYAMEKDDELAAKLRDFLGQLGQWRHLARQRPIAQTIWAIYQQTGYLAYCNGLTNGQQRCANLIELHQRAHQFGAFSHQGLDRFLMFLQSLDEQTDPAQAAQASQADDVVRIMSIHRSKGLEFPVVFVPEMGKQINLQSCHGDIVADRHDFLGVSAVDMDKHVRYPSLASMLVKDRLRQQALAEELRVLYVAMTRAKEHLILIGTCKESLPEEWGTRWQKHQGPLPTDAILGAKTMLDWIGPVAVANTAQPEPCIDLIAYCAEDLNAWCTPNAAVKASGQLAALAALQPLSPPPPTSPVAQEVIGRLEYRYPHAAYSSLPVTQSVTTWTKHDLPMPAKALASSAVSAPQPGDDLPLPQCMALEQQLSAADRGTAVHLVLEHLDFSAPCDADNLRQQITAMVDHKLVLPAQAEAADLPTLQWFINSPLGQLMRRCPSQLLPEFAITYAVPPAGLPANASSDPNDQIMLRGRIDLLIPDQRGFILVDYKTDRVDEQTLVQRVEVYKGQVNLYRQAIQHLTGRPVHTVHLVFLTARQIVTVE